MEATRREEAHLAAAEDIRSKLGVKMAKVMTDESNYSAIASQIRSKIGVSTRYKPSEMAAAIGSISGVSSADNGKVVVDGQLTQQTSRSVSQNGTYDTTTNNEVVVSVSGGGEPHSIFNADIVSQEYDGNIGTYQFDKAGYYLAYCVCDGSSSSTMSHSVTGANVVKQVTDNVVKTSYSSSFIGLIINASDGGSVTFSCNSVARSKMNVTYLTTHVSSFTDLTLQLDKDADVSIESFARTKDVVACAAGTTGSESVSVVVTSDTEPKYYMENASALHKVAMYDDCQAVTATAKGSSYASNYVIAFGFDIV